ncbi:MAG TPA: hypothetical protein DEB15_03475 [Pusillimonas sp.]|nr:hypothetical protein [Pusillimonas sp.]
MLALNGRASCLWLWSMGIAGVSAEWKRLLFIFMFLLYNHGLCNLILCWAFTKKTRCLSGCTLQAVLKADCGQAVKLKRAVKGIA